MIPAPMGRQIFALAWPVLIQQMLIFLVGQFDRWLAGTHAPPPGVSHASFQAAQTTANYLAWTVSCLSGLVSVGSTALVARFTGAGATADANRTLHQSMILALVIGLGASLAGGFSAPTLVGWVGLSGDSAGIASEFLTPIFGLLVFQVIEMAGIACLVGAGDTRTGLRVLGGVALLNMPLAYLGRELFGFPGIAFGTALSHVIGGTAVLVVLSRGRAGLTLERAKLRPDADLIRRLLRVSVPASIDTLSVGLCQLWFLSMVNGLGDVATAAHGIAIGWEGLGYMSGQALATAATALVGQNLGAGRPEQAARAGWTAFLVGGGIMSLMGVVFYVLAPQMFLLYCPAPEQAPVIEAGVPVLRLVAFAMPALASIIIFTGAMRGAGDTRVPLAITWIGFLGVRMPLAYVLIHDPYKLAGGGVWPAWMFGLYGAWLAMFADLALRGLFFVWRFAGGGWKRVKV